MKKTMRKVLNRHKLVAGFYVMVLWTAFLALCVLVCGALDGTVAAGWAAADTAAILLGANVAAGRLMKEQAFVDAVELLMADSEEAGE